MSKKALITGGAGGIAGELAPLLLRRGYQLILVDLEQTSLDARAHELGPGVATVCADLAQLADLERVAALIEATVDLDLMVNNAGMIVPGDVSNLTFETMSRHVSINLLAPMRVTQAALAPMIARRAGCILSIVSAACVVALPGSAAYTASKFGLRGFLTALSQEVATHGIRVRNIFPGAVDTPMLRLEATHGGSPLNFLNKEALTPRQVAEAAVCSMDRGALETYLPLSDGFTARLVGMAPGLIPWVLPSLHKMGEKGMRRYLASRGLKANG